MAHNRHYFSLPTEAPQRSRSGTRRPPLTPSTVSSPCVTTCVPVAARRDSNSSSGSPTKASVLLAKVVSSPTTPRSETPPLPSPEARMSQGQPDTDSYEKPAFWRSESDRYVSQYRQQDGYISFPDFERFRHNSSPFEQNREHTAVKT